MNQIRLQIFRIYLHQQLRVTSNVAGTNSFSADFSPDGTRLAFNTFDATNFMTQTMPVAGGARVVAHTVANTTGTQTPGAPKYSPDGTSFASVTFTNGGGGGTSDVLVYLADGTGTPSNITSSNTLFGGSVLGTSAWSINALRVGLFGGGTGAPTLPDAGHTSSKAPIALAIVATLAVIGIEAGRRVRIRR
jgi:dipeptidyl aminopeptidase/acylaminoacyl peptidase